MPKSKKYFGCHSQKMGLIFKVKMNNKVTHTNQKSLSQNRPHLFFAHHNGINDTKELMS